MTQHYPHPFTHFPNQVSKLNLNQNTEEVLLRNTGECGLVSFIGLQTTSVVKDDCLMCSMQTLFQTIQVTKEQTRTATCRWAAGLNLQKYQVSCRLSRINGPAEETAMGGSRKRKTCQIFGSNPKTVLLSQSTQENIRPQRQCRPDFHCAFLGCQNIGKSCVDFCCICLYLAS